MQYQNAFNSTIYSSLLLIVIDVHSVTIFPAYCLTAPEINYGFCV